MCELFAISSGSLTRVSLSLGRLAERGRPGGSLADGWGVACYDGRDVRVMREPEPAGGSPWLQHVFYAGRPYSQLVIAHIRHATRGGVCLANTQPFVRELGGRMHGFAHNGMLHGIDKAFDRSEQRFRPVGETDSEIAFCALLNRLGVVSRQEPPGVAQRLVVVKRFAAELRELGPANFLYSDGEVLFAHGDRRTQPSGAIAPPGLHVLVQPRSAGENALSAAGVMFVAATDAQPIVLFASVPLSEEGWEPLKEGQVVTVVDGTIVDLTTRERCA